MVLLYKKGIISIFLAVLTSLFVFVPFALKFRFELILSNPIDVIISYFIYFLIYLVQFLLFEIVILRFIKKLEEKNLFSLSFYGFILIVQFFVLLTSLGVTGLHRYVI